MPVWLRRIVLAPHNLTVLRWLVQGPQPTCAPAQKSVINRIWLLLSASDRLIMMIGPSGLLLVVPHLPMCCLSFSFMGGVVKKYITKLGCETYFCKVTYSAPLEMLLHSKHCHVNYSTLLNLAGGNWNWNWTMNWDFSHT
jgi:hypothetical protein